MDLKYRNCVPITAGTEPLKNTEINSYLSQLSPGWQQIENRQIRKEFPFQNFKKAMTFAQVIALIAEKEKHHPDLCISYHKVDINLSTHSIGGLSENDFIMAAKFEDIYQ
jgi:4a-hydroxytetrahydrobiopterin dehydratase